MDIDEDDSMDKMRKTYLAKVWKLGINNGMEGNVGVSLKALRQQIPPDICMLCASKRVRFVCLMKRLAIQCEVCKSKLGMVGLKRKKGSGATQEKITLDKPPHLVPSEKPARPSPLLSVDKKTNKSKNRVNKLRNLAGFDDDKRRLASNSSLLSFVNSLK